MTGVYEPKREMLEILSRVDDNAALAFVQLAKMYLVEVVGRGAMTGRIELHVKDGTIRLHKAESVVTWD